MVFTSVPLSDAAQPLGSLSLSQGGQEPGGERAERGRTHRLQTGP